MNTLQFILDHWKGICSIVFAIHTAAVHTYILVWHAGGYRTLWRNFQGPISNTNNEPTKKDLP